MTELQIVSYFNHLGLGTFLDGITIVVSYIPLLAVIWLFLTLFAYRYDKKNGRLVFLSALVAVLLYFIINDVLFKTVLADLLGTKLRPYIAEPGTIIPIGKQFIDSSFPSGHVASSTAVLAVLSHFYKRYWIPSVIFILFMMFARMHMGMHYPSDILGGLALGMVYSVCGIKIAKKILRRKTG